MDIAGGGLVCGGMQARLFGVARMWTSAESTTGEMGWDWRCAGMCWYVAWSDHAVIGSSVSSRAAMQLVAVGSK